MPLAAIVLAMLAVVLSRTTPRQGRFGKLFTAILAYIIYSNLLLVAQTWLQRGTIPPWLGLWWVHLLFATAALVLFRPGLWHRPAGAPAAGTDTRLMRIIDRYIGVTVAVGTAHRDGGAAGADDLRWTWSTSWTASARESYGLAQAAEYVLLTIPRTAYGLFPSAALLGSLLGLGVLAGHRELVVIRAAGVSLAQLVWAVMKVGLLMMIAAVEP